MKAKILQKRYLGECVTAQAHRTFILFQGWRMFCSLFFVAAAIAVLGGIGSSLATGQDGPSATVNKIDSWVIEHTANSQQAEMMIVLVDQADLGPAAALGTKNEKSRYVHDTLWSKSQATQGPIVQWLRERGLEFRSFYIFNSILVKGSREVAEALAARPDVARVEGNPQIQNFLPQPIPAVETPSQPDTANTIGPNIRYTHAPQVWALGFTGQGLVIGSADTGVRWTHNALKRHYRGWNGTLSNHNYNWHDSVHNSVGNPCGNNAQAPCDDHGHGSHTIGTAVGDDAMGNQIGMAPGAKWIGCRNMDRGTGTPARYLECMEFFLAPYPVNGTPAQGDPTLAPDITTNSWTCPTSEGCSVNTLRAAVEAQQAAGIMMVVAAGNQGPGCFTLLSPPSFYQASYTVGALNTGTDSVALFSNRGPVTVDGSHRLKPDITAPGTDIRSSVNTSDNAYATMRGTSMATPHIAGAVALLWSARPEWRRDIGITQTAINDAAVHILNGVCDSGQPVTPNNTYGHGRVDILAAVTRPNPTPSPTPNPTSSPTPSPTPSPTLARAAVGDFNNDGHPDYVLHNTNTRQTAIWYLNNNVLVGTHFGPNLAAGWDLRALGDFNVDSHLDYALFALGTHQTALWYLSGSTFIGGAYGPTLPNRWELVGTADFNGDSNPDYVLYNVSTRQTAIWYLNNNLLIGSDFGPTLLDRWLLVGVADFDGDGQTDYLLFYPDTGYTAIAYLSGTTLVGGAWGPTIPGNWTLVATADFNADSKPDYVLYNVITRQTAIWYLNNNLFVGGAFGPTIPVGWSLTAP